jgi:hypothetical protein
VHHTTAEAFAGGQSLQLPMVREVLHCYQQSSASTIRTPTAGSKRSSASI